MAWARLDDRFSEHPKIIGLSDRAFRLHVTAIVYAARNRTDGHVPGPLARTWGYPARFVSELLAAGLWEKADGGYLIHDYLEYNPSRADLEEKDQKIKSARSLAGKRGAAARWQRDDEGMANAMANAMANGSQTEWQTDGPNPLEEEEIYSPGSVASSSGDRAGAMRLPCLPWQRRAAETLKRAGHWSRAEARGYGRLSEDFEAAQIESAYSRCEAKAQLPFVHNLRAELIAEFGEPEWTKARRGPARYG